MAATPRIEEAELLRIKFDTGYDRAGYAGKWMAAMAALDVRDDPRLQAAQRLLGTWDWSEDGKGTGDALAALVLRPAMKWSYKRAPVMPDLRNELKIAADHLMTHFGTLDPPLGALMRVRRGKVDLPMDGASDTLRAATLWDLDPDGRARVKHGDSFVMLIDWDATGRVASRSIQPFGAATTRPQSPHYADQAALFVKHQFKPVHFDRADIIAHAARIYRP
jgi:acyl-homoserine-lactone acylase